MTALSFLTEDIQALKDQHLYQSLRVMASAQETEVVLEGKRVLNFSSNNYLGLTRHPTLMQAAIQAIQDYGVGTASVRTIIGTMDMHQALEQELAAFKHTESSLVLQSGYTANLAAITPIMGEGDVILSDELNHASIIDACRMCKQTPTVVFRHKDMNHLEERLIEHRYARRKLIITDGVFSMDGDIAPLPEIVRLAREYDAITMVDDAHGSGVLGKNGRGTVSHYGLEGQVDIQVGTLSKALAAMGGYVAGPESLRQMMINRARPFLFSTSHPPSVIATARAAVALLLSDSQLLDKLWENTRFFKAGLQAMGYPLESETPILPVIAGSSEKAQQLSRELYDRGIFAQAIVFPTVAKDKARVRLIVTAAHTQAQLEQALEGFEVIGKKLALV